MVFELYLIKYLKYRSQIQIQPSLKSQIQIQIRILSVFKYKYKYVFDPNPGGGRGIPSFIMVSCAMVTKVCAAHINYLKLLCFLFYLLTV